MSGGRLVGTPSRAESLSLVVVFLSSRASYLGYLAQLAQILLIVSFVYKTTQIFLFSTSKPPLKTKTHLDAFYICRPESSERGKDRKDGKDHFYPVLILPHTNILSHHGLLTCSWCSEVPFKQSQQISVNVGSWGIPSKKRWRKYQTKHLVPRQQI